MKNILTAGSKNKFFPDMKALCIAEAFSVPLFFYWLAWDQGMSAALAGGVFIIAAAMTVEVLGIAYQEQISRLRGNSLRVGALAMFCIGSGLEACVGKHLFRFGEVLGSGIGTKVGTELGIELGGVIGPELSIFLGILYVLNFAEVFLLLCRALERSFPLGSAPPWLRWTLESCLAVPMAYGAYCWGILMHGLFLSCIGICIGQITFYCLRGHKTQDLALPAWGNNIRYTVLMFSLASMLTQLLICLIYSGFGTESLMTWGGLMPFMTPVCFLLCWISARFTGSPPAYGLNMAQGALAAPLIVWAAMRCMASFMHRVDVAILIASPLALGTTFWAISKIAQDRPLWSLWGKRFVVVVGSLIFSLGLVDLILRIRSGQWGMLCSEAGTWRMFWGSFALLGAFNGFFATRARRRGSREGQFQGQAAPTGLPRASP